MTEWLNWSEWTELRQHIKKKKWSELNWDNILKSRDITLPTKVCLVKAIVFSVVMYRCESWTIKKAERQRIDAFELWCWKRLLRVPWTARRSNQSILKEISPKCSLKGPMLKLKLQYFGHLMQRTDSLEKAMMLGKIEDRRRRGRQRMRWLHGITDSMDMSLSILQGLWWTGWPGVLQSMGSQKVGHDWATELTDWLPEKTLQLCLCYNSAPGQFYSILQSAIWAISKNANPLPRWAVRAEKPGTKVHMAQVLLFHCL